METGWINCFTIAGINEDTPFSRNYEVKEIHRHPQYDSNESLNDIAVIITKEFINFNRGVGIACLPGLNEEYVEDVRISHSIYIFNLFNFFDLEKKLVLIYTMASE